MDVLIISAHPCADSLSHAVVASARQGLERAGHTATVIDLYDIGFRAEMSLPDLQAYRAQAEPPDPMVRAHIELIRTAQVLVFVYPTWWGGPPAVLKGWLERVLVPGVAFRFDERGRVRPGMTHVRRVVGISTYGSPWLYAKLVTDVGRRMIMRALRLNCGWRTTTTWLGLYSVDTAGPNDRAAFLDRVEHQMASVS